MKHLIELHILQNFAPSNLNRDDTGSPKDAFFGGVRRGRISSQCLKRAAREYVRAGGLVPPEHMARRTKRVTEELVRALQARGRPEAESLHKAIAALGGVGLKVKDAEEGKTEYLLFLGQAEVERVAEFIDRHWDALNAQAEPKGEKRKAKDAKKEAKAAIPPELKKALEKVLDGGRAVDVALFGRMLADLPQANQEAACQVAHALSTAALEREFDFYTAVDDLKPDDNAGADMLGTVEFGSSCFYRYVALDVTKLRENLQGDDELVLRGLEAFLRAMVKAKPSGKQNSFAAHNDPEYVAVTVRQGADPRNLANAFEKPVRPSPALSLTEASVERLEARWEKLAAAYGQNGPAFVLNLTDAQSRLGEPVESLDELIGRTLAEVRAGLGA